MNTRRSTWFALYASALVQSALADETPQKPRTANIKGFAVNKQNKMAKIYLKIISIKI